MTTWTVIFLKNRPEIGTQEKVAYKKVKANTKEEADIYAGFWVACHVPNMEYDETEVIETERMEEM